MTDCCTYEERNGIAWLKAGSLKLTGIRKGLEEGRCPLWLEDVDANSIVSNCSELKVEILFHVIGGQKGTVVVVCSYCAVFNGLPGCLFALISECPIFV